MRIATTFDEVAVRATKSGICPACGKRATRSMKFWQTINPWNRKTREQILREERKKADKWRREPVYHAKCEP